MIGTESRSAVARKGTRELLGVVVTGLCKLLRSQRNIYLKRVNFTTYKLYLNKSCKIKG